MTIPDSLKLMFAHHAAGRLADAESLSRSILAVDPNCSEAIHMLGRIAYEVGKIDDALTLITRALQLDPTAAGTFNLRGTIYASTGRFRQAIPDYQQAIRLRPNFPEACNNLGNVCRELSLVDEAIAAYQHALKLRPDYPACLSNLAISLKDQGRVPEAIAAFDRALALNPTDAIADSNRLYSLQFLPNLTPAQLLEEHKRWNHRRAAHIPTRNSQLATRNFPLRLAYLSGDFRFHSVAFFLLPLLRSHDHKKFHITCYPTTPHNDFITAQFRSSSDQWTPLLGLSDAQATEKIASDSIDILIDLAGHTSGHRLGVLARKPAPIQISYLGYANTTGLETIDYRLTDENADPPGAEKWYTEKLLRLPRTAWCFTSLAGSPDIQPRDDGPITFGSFNDLAKINPPLISLWAKILHSVPNSRLTLKNRAINSAYVRDHLQRAFADLGIPPDRLELIRPINSPEEHLKAYSRIDIALDTFPYHGTTTTCEALYMGVPVITLAGQTHVSRVGVSLLTSAALPDLIAPDAPTYIHLATTLAADTPRRRHLRQTLRQTLTHSPLMDEPSFARDVEAAYESLTGPKRGRS